MKMYYIFMAEIAMLCKEFLGHSIFFDLAYKTCRDTKLLLCKDFLGHSMILDVVSKTCRDMSLHCSARKF